MELGGLFRFQPGLDLLLFQWMIGIGNIGDAELARELMELEREDRRLASIAADAVSVLRRSTKLDYLLFLQKAMDAGREIEEGWSNFMFDKMYTVDSDFEYAGRTFGSGSMSFILKEDCSLKVEGRAGHELVYDMERAVERSIDGSWTSDRIPVPRECLAAFRLMKKWGVKPNRLLALLF